MRPWDCAPVSPWGSGRSDGESGGLDELDDEGDTGDTEGQEEQDDGDHGEGSHRTADPTAMTTVRFLTRSKCRICAEVRPIVQRRVARKGWAFEVVDVDESGLADEYGDRVPVVLTDGAEVLSGRFTRRDVRRALR